MHGAPAHTKNKFVQNRLIKQKNCTKYIDKTMTKRVFLVIQDRHWAGRTILLLPALLQEQVVKGLVLRSCVQPIGRTDPCSISSLLFGGKQANFREEDKRPKGSRHERKVQFFLKLFKQGGGGQTHVQKFLLQIWYFSGGYLAI